jgi:hypothetical protein
MNITSFTLRHFTLHVRLKPSTTAAVCLLPTASLDADTKFFKVLLLHVFEPGAQVLTIIQAYNAATLLVSAKLRLPFRPRARRRCPSVRVCAVLR